MPSLTTNRTLDTYHYAIETHPASLQDSPVFNFEIALQSFPRAQIQRFRWTIRCSLLLLILSLISFSCTMIRETLKRYENPLYYGSKSEYLFAYVYFWELITTYTFSFSFVMIYFTFFDIHSRFENRNHLIFCITFYGIVNGIFVEIMYLSGAINELTSLHKLALNYKIFLPWVRDDVNDTFCKQILVCENFRFQIVYHNLIYGGVMPIIHCILIIVCEYIKFKCKRCLNINWYYVNTLYQPVFNRKIILVGWFVIYWFIWFVLLTFLFILQNLIPLIDQYWEYWFYTLLVSTSMAKFLLKKIARYIDQNRITMMQSFLVYKSYIYGQQHNESNDNNSNKSDDNNYNHNQKDQLIDANSNYNYNYNYNYAQNLLREQDFLVSQHRSRRTYSVQTLTATGDKNNHKYTVTSTINSTINMDSYIIFSFEWFNECLLSLIYWSIYYWFVSYSLNSYNENRFLFFVAYGVHLISEICQTTFIFSFVYYRCVDYITKYARKESKNNSNYMCLRRMSRLFKNIINDESNYFEISVRNSVDIMIRMFSSMTMGICMMILTLCEGKKVVRESDEGTFSNEIKGLFAAFILDCVYYTITLTINCCFYPKHAIIDIWQFVFTKHKKLFVMSWFACTMLAISVQQ